jgi:hypothetical protein
MISFRTLFSCAGTDLLEQMTSLTVLEQMTSLTVLEQMTSLTVLEQMTSFSQKIKSGWENI